MPERLSTRVNQDAKDLFEKALPLSGYSSLNGFIVNAAILEAKKLIEQEMRIQLLQENASLFLSE